MNLFFEKVLPSEKDKIAEVYGILKRSEEDMYYSQGLVHWKTPYPIDAIKRDCAEREVYIAKNLDSNQFVHTFQLDFKPFGSQDANIEEVEDEIKTNVVYLRKFATDPQVSGKGIGKQSMNFIENYCRSMGISKICLDVYEKSQKAIQFYIKNGFIVIGSKPTKHFRVYVMEKQL